MLFTQMLRAKLTGQNNIRSTKANEFTATTKTEQSVSKYIDV